MDYHAYLRSPEWREKRKQIWRRARGRCERCNGDGSDVHHLTYDRLGDEDLEDLALYCRLCHGYEHGRSLDDMLNEALAKFCATPSSRSFGPQKTIGEVWQREGNKLIRWHAN